MNKEIQAYNDSQDPVSKAIFDKLANEIDANLQFTENKLWHGHPVWFIDGNPIVGYSLQKPGARLMFWSGKSFDEPDLDVVGEKYQDASIFYNSLDEISVDDLIRWLKKSEEIQWDYKNIVKRKGELERLK